MATIYKYKTTTTVDVYRDINSFDRNENPISTIPSDKFVYGKYENSAQTFRQFYNDPGGIQSIGWARTYFFIQDMSYSPASSTSSTTTNTTPRTNTNTSSTKTKPKTSNTTVVNGTVLPNSTIYNQYIVKAAGGLNIRQTTNANSTALGSLPNKTRIYAKPAIATGWSEYSKDGKFPTGYVSSKFLEKVSAASTPFPPVTPITASAPPPITSLINLTPKSTVFQADNRADYLQNLETNNILQQDLKNVAALLDPLKTAALNGTLNKDTLKSFGNQLWETEKQKLIRAGTDNELVTLYKTKYDLIKKELQLEAEHALAIIKLKYLRTPKSVLTNAATGSERTANAGNIIRGEGTLGETGSFGPTLSQQLNSQQVVTNSGAVDEATLRLNEAIAGSSFIPALLKFEIPTSIGDLYPLDQKVIDDYLATPTGSRTELTVANLYYYIQNSSEVQKRNEQYTQKIAEFQKSQNQPQINQNGGFTNTNPFTPNGGLPASFAGNGVPTVNGFKTYNTKNSPLTSLTSYTPSPQLQAQTKNTVNAGIAFLQSTITSNNSALNKYDGITDKNTNPDAAVRWLKLWLAEDTSYRKNKAIIDKAQEENNKAINEFLKDPFKKIKDEIKKRKEARDALKRRTKREKRACRKRRAKKLAKAALKTITPILINYLSNKLIDVVAQNNKIRALVERTNNYILLYEGEDPIFIYTSPDSSLYKPKNTTQGLTAAPPITLSFAKKVRDNAIKIINTNRKLLNDINKGIENAQKYISIFDIIVTIISNIPIPSSVPPGIGVPVSLIMKFVKILDKANKIILAISNYLPQVTSILEPAIEKLNEYENQIKAINEKLDDAAASGINDTPAMVGSGQNAAGTTDPSVNGVEYQGFRFAIREEDTTYGSKALKRHYAVAIDANDTEVLQSERSFTLDPDDLVEQLKVVIDRRKLFAGVRVNADGQTQSSGSFQVAGAPDAGVINKLSNPYYQNDESATQIQQQILAQQQLQQQAQQPPQQQYPPLTQAQRIYYQNIIMSPIATRADKAKAAEILKRNYV
jgi:hypothetical protein